MNRWLLLAILSLAACSTPATSTSTTTNTTTTTATATTTTTTANPVLSAPPARGYVAMASLTDELGVMVFGGFETPPAPDGDGSPLVDTWFYGADWVEVGEEPPAAGGNTVAFDDNSGQVVLYALVRTDWSNVTELWSYDIAQDRWSEISGSEIPSGLFVPSLVFDSESDVALLIGPSSGSVLETWAYDVAEDRWADMKPETAPPTRDFFAVTYDAVSDRVLLFGGFAGGEEAIGDTWAYDYNSNKWTDMTTSSSPSPRGYTAMAHDPNTDKTYLFGGQPYPDSVNDTWAFEFGTSSWTELFPTSAPPPRGTHGMAYNPVDHSMVMFGGGMRVGGGPDWEALPAETWIYDPSANTWTQRS